MVCVLRAIAPAISNSLFSLSIEKGGYIVHFVFVCSAALAIYAALLLPKDEKQQRRMLQETTL